MRVPTGVLIAAAVVGLAGCGSDAPNPATQDAPPASQVEPSWSEASALRVAEDPELTIGVLNGDAGYQFQSVSAAVRQSDGDLVIADAGTRTVRLYDSSGGLKMTLGGPGWGPGEFQRPTQLLLDEDDSILVWDDAVFRVTRFDAEGALVDIRAVPLDALAKAVRPPLYPASGVLLGSGELLVRLVEKNGKHPPEGRFRPESGALLASADLEHVEVAVRFPGVEQITVESPWGALAVEPPLARRTSIAVHPREGWYCVGEQERAAVRCLGSDGSWTGVRWTDEPVPVSAGHPEIEAWRNRTSESFGQKLSPDDVRKLVAQIPAPSVLPPYTGLVIDAAGNLWVDVPASQESPTSRHLVFDASGRWLGSVALPPIRVLSIGADHVVGVHRDELDVEYVQVFALSKPGGSER